MKSSQEISLFVGNVSRNVQTRQLEDEFFHFGPCKVVHRSGYAFIEYRNERDADSAKNAIHGKNLGGLCVNVQWSKRSGNFDEADPAEQVPKDLYKDRCYNCGKRGHISRDCTEQPECYECKSRGHKARECPRRMAPTRSRSPRRVGGHESPLSTASERSYSLDRFQLACLPNVYMDGERSENLDVDESDLEFPSEREQPPEIGPLVLEGASFEALAEGSYRCIACDKAMKKSSVKRHVGTKQHRENQANK
jgi:RNA recognition motif-containing protein